MMIKLYIKKQRGRKMIVEPKVRGFICTTAHPEGCSANVLEQINYVKKQPKTTGPKAALIIGSSTGYGLASRISAAFGSGAATIGVAFERPAAGSRTATAGWYNTAAFENYAAQEGLYAKSIMGDAFSDEIKQQTIELIKKEIGKVDLVIYSLAAPKRSYGGVTYGSVLKPVGSAFTSKTIDLNTMNVTTVAVPAASEEEVDGTIKVMGGEDWRLWIEALSGAGVLSEGAVTVAYSYIGPVVTHAIYRDGTVGMAKKDLEKAAREITVKLSGIGGKGYVSVNKALVTQASSAIPVVPLYISILFKIMKGKGTHEGCIEQMHRLFADKLYVNRPVLDEEGRLRVDDLELKPDVQALVDKAWAEIDNGNIREFADIDGYRQDFYRLFGFGVNGVDYGRDVETDVKIPSIG
jgi:enoyl-[acyl-carrier protein] reductase/trans-2-enoyl-CoA reductase (NAD+)